MFHSVVHLRMPASGSVRLRRAERGCLRFAGSANCGSAPGFPVCARCVVRPDGCRIRATAGCDVLVAGAIDRVDGCVCCAAVARAGGARQLAPGRTALGGACGGGGGLLGWLFGWPERVSGQAGRVAGPQAG